MLSAQELQSSTQKELMQELQSAQSEMQRIRLGVTTNNIKDSSLASRQKRYVARIKTILRELELEALVKEASEA